MSIFIQTNYSFLTFLSVRNKEIESLKNAHDFVSYEFQKIRQFLFSSIRQVMDHYLSQQNVHSPHLPESS